jgi:hypothetical protein
VKWTRLLSGCQKQIGGAHSVNPVNALRKRAPLPASNGTPNKKHDDGPNGRTNKTGTLACAIPAESLSQEARDECSHDAQDCGQDKTTRLVITGGDELRIVQRIPMPNLLQIQPT